METLDPAAEWLRLSERYRQMTDDELLALGRQISEMTELAQQVLAQEISQRKLKLEPEEPTEGQIEVSTAPLMSQPLEGASGPDTATDPDVYVKDRELVEICTVWSSSDALQVQRLLDRAGIPFFMGPEKATCVDDVTSNIAAGVKVRIMRVGWPWASQALQYYTPANEPELDEVEIRCPKCRSTEVVFERLVSETADAAEKSSSKFEWTCDSCGHQWQDEGSAIE